MKPICVKCERFMRPTKSGFYFTEGMPLPGERLVQPGLMEPARWTSYKVWVGDKWTCPDCGTEIIVGVPGIPIAEHYQADFVEQQKRLGADKLLIKDC